MEETNGKITNKQSALDRHHAKNQLLLSDILLMINNSFLLKYEHKW